MINRLQAYETVGHVLSALEQMHERIGEVLSDFGTHTSDERRRLNLEYLAEHQRRRAADLTAYCGRATEPVLEMWLQVPFPEQPGELIAELQAQDADQGSITKMIAAIDDFTGRLLTHMRDRAETPDAKKMFEGLLDIENQERRLRSRALASFAQI